MTRKRSNTRRPKRTNPARRRTHSPALRANAHRRRHNPTHRRQRRNPAIKPLIMGAVYTAAGAVLTDIAMGLIPLRIGGAWGTIGMKFGVGYGIGMLAEKFGLRAQADYLALGGAASAASDAFQLVRGKFPAVLQAAAVPVQAVPPQGPQPGQNSAAMNDTYYDGAGDIVAYGSDGDNDYYGATAGMGDYEGFGDIVLYPNY